MSGPSFSAVCRCDLCVCDTARERGIVYLYAASHLFICVLNGYVASYIITLAKMREKNLPTGRRSVNGSGHNSRLKTGLGRVGWDGGSTRESSHGGAEHRTRNCKRQPSPCSRMRHP